MIQGKLPPQAIDIETVVLGALMIDSNCLSIALSRLFTEIFYLEKHQFIFTAIQNIYDKGNPVDIMTVIEQLKRNEKLEQCEGAYYITKLTNSVISGANIESHILILSEMYLKRQTITICGTAIQDGYDEGTDAFDVINTADEEMQKMQERVLVGMSRDISYFGMQMLRQHAEVKQTGVLGIRTGLVELDRVMCGLVPPDLVIIAARPGQGKTAIALSITYNASIKNDTPCAWFSLEMDGVQLVRRLASIDTGIDHEKIRNGRTDKAEDLRLGESIDRITAKKIFIEDKTSMNVRDIRTKASLLKKKHKIKYIVVDYIQLMNGTDTKNKNREQIVSEISRALKCIAKELEIPVIALSQLSRAVEGRADKLPQLSDLRESGGIEQDADEVIFLMRPEYYKMTESVMIGGKEYHPNGLCICSIAKNRHGATTNVALNFKGQTMHFLNNIEHDNNFQPEGSWRAVNDN